MVVCREDGEVAGAALGWQLAAWQALLLHRVLPSLGGLLVYLTLFCYDLALLVQHYRDGDNFLGAILVILMITPALCSLVFTLASPPPGLATEDSALAFSIEKQDVLWILTQIINFIIFPLTGVMRYCYQIFWSVEAVCASRAEDASRTQAALKHVQAPSPVELYLFLQAFLHSAPHAVLNILTLMTTSEQPAFEKVALQAVSIITSTLRMASTATIYRRFEREKLSGRKYPWRSNIEDSEDERSQVQILNQTMVENNENKKDIFEGIDYNIPSLLDKDNEPEENVKRSHNSVIEQPSQPSLKNKGLSIINNFDDIPKKMDKSYSFIDKLKDPDSDSSSTEFSDMPLSYDEKVPLDNSDEEYERPKSIIDRVAPRRRDPQPVVEIVHVTPPPSTPAPRIAYLSILAEKIIENAETITDRLEAPHRRRYHSETMLDALVPLPKHVPRNYMRGLEPQDITAAFVHFLAWHMFFVARLLSIAAFIHFFPVLGIVITYLHYKLMLILLIVPQASTVKRAFYIFLAFTYIFCLLEFKVRFRHVRAWHVFWLVLCTIETVIFTACWAAKEHEVSGWWKQYVILVVMSSMCLSYMCMAVYYVLLKPKETVVYFKEVPAKYAKTYNTEM